MSADRVLAVGIDRRPLAHSALDPAAVLDGSPGTGSSVLHAGAGVEIGLWEITPGTVTDIEVDEVFVVLSGRGEVSFADGARIELVPGTVVHLNAGDRTAWRIHETLRKIYIFLPIDPTPGAARA